MDLNAQFTRPMRDELTAIGFQELRTPAEVDAALSARTGSVLVFVNSVCGCPSSPSIALLKDGALVGYVPRHQIEGRTGEAVGAHIAELLEAHCTKV